MRKVILAAAVLAAALPAFAGQEEVFEKAYSMEGVAGSRSRTSTATSRRRPGTSRTSSCARSRGPTARRAEETLRLTEIRVQKIGDEIKRRDHQPEAPAALRLPRLRRRERPRRLRPADPGEGRGALRDLQRQGRRASGFPGTLSGDAVNGSIELRRDRGSDERQRRSTARSAWLSTARSGRAHRDGERLDRGRLRKTSSGRYDLETVNGHIEGDFDLPVEGKFGPKEARGSYNGGSRIAPLRNGQRHDPPASTH